MAISKVIGTQVSSIKKINGVVIASCKKISGVDNVVTYSYWRFYQDSVYSGYSHSPRVCELRWKDIDGNTITPTSFDSGGTFLYGSGGEVANTFDGATNTSDVGWIADNGCWIRAYFSTPRAFVDFGAYTSYSGARGGVWVIQKSNNGTDWTTVKTWNFVSTSGTGWYDATW